ncbi:Uncharacterised protein [Mycobacteroides abscessus subsp. abscessus]|nr:Uncharacterised protein [Mycobacteroides abscessus subsp. abscessus]
MPDTATRPMIGMEANPTPRGLVNSEPMIAPIGKVASMPSRTTPASANQAPAESNSTPPTMNIPGRSTTTNGTSTQPDTSTILPTR